MAISYPLSFPSHTGVRSIEIRARNAVSISRSPFTYDQQVHAYSGQCWEADVSLPPMKASDAEQWIAFLMSLRGQYGTFTMGDTLNTSLRGTASSVSINGTAGQSSIDVNVPNGETLLAGDWLQFGSASDATLHKVLQNYTGTGSLENDSLEIWPALRKDRTTESGATVNYTVTVSGGVFYIDGVSKPQLNLVRGNTYIFDQSDSSNTNHPLVFKDTSDNSYTTGVTVSGTAGSTGATVTIVVASDAPSSLKYSCSVHGNNMGNTISVTTSSTVAGVVSNTVGVWRLNVNETVWNINEASVYGLTFGCVEAI